MLARLEQFLHSQYSIYVVAALIVAIGFGIGRVTAPVTITAEQIVACGRSEMVEMLSVVEMYKSMSGQSKAEMEKGLAESIKQGLPKQEAELAQKALDFAFAKDYKEGPIVAYVAECLSKK